MSAPLWTPSKERVENANVTKFIGIINQKFDTNLRSFDELWAWSVKQPRAFWEECAKFTRLISSDLTQSDLLENRSNMWEQHFFPQASLNFAENLLRRNDETTAIHFWGEVNTKSSLTFKQLNAKVTQLANSLKDRGLKAGDRVAAFVPNTPEVVIAMLAVTSLGGVWCSCSPDFGSDGALDRFEQIDPVFLFAANGYYYNGKPFDRMEQIEKIAKGLPNCKQTIVYNYTDTDTKLSSGMIAWNDFISSGSNTPLAFEKFPFNHPLYIMFSSGTTGKPKCIVHGAGGTLLQHLKEHQLHMDIKKDDVVYYFTTCGWMMWNWLVSALASEASIALFDGSPFIRRGRILIDMIDEIGITMFGVSAKYIDAIAKIQIKPKDTHKLNSLRTIGSTGSPLSHESFEYVYREFKEDVALVSLSGGTDIVSCFALGNPIGPIYKGELQSRGLGLNVDVFNNDGHSIAEEKGELVCTKPFPCMPLKFWGDKNHSRYKKSYFDRFDNVWCHGDYVELTQNKGIVFHGRSDSVLNPGGVRIGTAEICRQVEKVHEVMECFVVGQDWQEDIRIVLFVKLRDDIKLSEEICDNIRNTVQTNTTRRHVPSVIIQVQDIPKTRSGKIVELAVRDIIHGREIANKDAIANPAALEFFKDIPALKI